MASSVPVWLWPRPTSCASPLRCTCRKGSRPMNMFQPEAASGRSPEPEKGAFEIRHVVFDVRDAHDLNANGLFRVARQLASEQRAAGELAKVYFLRLEGRAVPEDGGGVLEILPMRGRQLAGHHITIDDGVFRALTRNSGK